jgi:hypothetical protein
MTTSAAAPPLINGQHKSLLGNSKHCSPLGIFSCYLFVTMLTFSRLWGIIRVTLVYRRNPRRGGRQQPHQTLKKSKKYKGGKKHHLMVTQSTPKMPKWHHSALKACSILSWILGSRVDRTLVYREHYRVWWFSSSLSPKALLKTDNLFIFHQSKNVVGTKCWSLIGIIYMYPAAGNR